MKGRLVAFVGVFCIAMLIASGAYADKPPKEPKPPKPANIAVECIEFTGDLASVPLGGTVVEGCCPNAGPLPAYRMTLDVKRIVDDTPVSVVEGTYDGYLFAKPVSTKVKGQTTVRYLVQFCTWDWGTEIPGDDDYFIEMFSDGDDIDETDNVLTVTFDNDHEDDTVTVWVLRAVSPDCDLSIYPDFYPDCENPCVVGEPACVASDDANCNHPCNEEITDVNVNFIMTKTTDLSYCE